MNTPTREDVERAVNFYTENPPIRRDGALHVVVEAARLYLSQQEELEREKERITNIEAARVESNRQFDLISIERNELHDNLSRTQSALEQSSEQVVKLREALQDALHCLDGAPYDGGPIYDDEHYAKQKKALSTHQLSQNKEGE